MCIIDEFNVSRRKKENVFMSKLVKRPWGNYTVLAKSKDFLLKKIMVLPEGVLSYQSHNYRSEHWVIIKGIPKITLNKKLFFKKPYETIFIPKGAIHRIHNPSQKPVKIMEAQLGSILKESDIVRYKDIYGRAN